MHILFHEIRKLQLIERSTKCENEINKVIDMRKGNDAILTEQQKEKLRELKVRLKNTKNPLSSINNLYEDIHRSFSQTKRLEEDKKYWLKQAKAIGKKLRKTEKEISSVMTINKNKKKNKSDLQPEERQIDSPTGYDTNGIPYTDL